MTLRFAPPFERAGGYKPSKPNASLRLDLAGNEGRGPDPAFLRVALDDWAPALRRYPSTASLVEALCDRVGVGAERLLVTNGGDEAIDRACRIMLCPGRNAVVPSPTFEMVPRYVYSAGAELREVDAAPSAVEAAIGGATDDATAFISIVSPNNPSGEVTDPDVFVRVARANPGALLLADLAYVEFADEDPTAQLLEEPNIVVIRTLSKAWGLAGLRLGYALGSAEVIGRMRGAGGPYSVTGPSAAIGARWLREGSEVVEAFIARVRREVGELTTALRARGWTVFASQANFVTLESPDACAFAEDLLASGIRVRSWPNDPERRSFVRITCPGDPADFAVLLEAIEQARAGSPRVEKA